MANNADLDFEISEEDMTYLRNIDTIKDYGATSMMPVFGGKLNLYQRTLGDGNRMSGCIS